MEKSTIEPKHATLVFSEDSITFNLVLSLKNSYFGQVESALQVITKEFDSLKNLSNLFQIAVLNECQNAIAKNKKAKLEDDEIIKMMDINFCLFTRDDYDNEKYLVKDVKMLPKVRLILFKEVYIVKIQKLFPVVIELPEAVFINTILEPAVFKPFEFREKDFYFKWFKTKDKVLWIEIGSRFILPIRKEELGNYLMIECAYNGKKYEFITENVVSEKPAMPTNCPFQVRQEKIIDYLQNDCFRVASYNILSNRYTNRRYSYCPPEYLSEYYRRDLILKEILGYKADIICLQEADEKLSKEFFIKELKTNGFDGVFHSKNESITEGVLTLFNTNRLRLVGTAQKIVFKNIIRQPFLKHVWNVLQTDKATQAIFTRKAQIAHILKLEVKGTEDIIYVINTHLYFDYDGPQVRLFQVICCLETLKQIMYAEDVRNKKRAHVVFCGDFNSETTSDVYKFLTKGAIQCNNKTENMTCTPTLHHPFDLKSAYLDDNFTNFTDSFKECIDYIFYSSFDLIDKLPLFDNDVLTENVALPSRVFPSDHIALVADLKLY